MALPFGIGRQKPHHYREMARIAWENRDQLPFAWRILSQGVCDGCALGTSGLSDWTLPGVHLCMVRLELMRLNTAPPLDVPALSDVRSLNSLPSKALRALGLDSFCFFRHLHMHGCELVPALLVHGDTDMRHAPIRSLIECSCRNSSVIATAG